MREIKFRAWDKRFSKMDYGSGSLLLRINKRDFSEPMQYTGLKDKNGKEIYEGDIVEKISDVVVYSEDYDELDDEYQIKNIGEVRVYPSRGVVMVNNKTLKDGEQNMETFSDFDGKEFTCPFNFSLTKVVGRRSEVIGNIHDNPELLTNNNDI